MKPHLLWLTRLLCLTQQKMNLPPLNTLVNLFYFSTNMWCLEYNHCIKQWLLTTSASILSSNFSASTFRLNINVHRPIGGYRRHVPAPEPEGPRLPVGMAPIQAPSAGAMLVGRRKIIRARHSHRQWLLFSRSSQSKRYAVSECKAFNKAHLCWTAAMGRDLSGGLTRLTRETNRQTWTRDLKHSITRLGNFQTKEALGVLLASTPFGIFSPFYFC